MIKRGLLILLIIAALVCCATAQTNLDDILENLGFYQGGDGGFVNKLLNSDNQLSTKGNLEETSNGVFLGTLFSQTDKFSVPGVGEFIKDRAAEQGGFSAENGEAPNLVATVKILAIYNNLGAKMPNPQDILAFTRSLYDENKGLYAVDANSQGSVEGTAAALQIFSILGMYNAPFVSANFPKINEILNSSIVEQGFSKYFSFPDEKLAVVESSYYAAIIASISGFQVEKPESFSAYFASLQNSDGGFSMLNAAESDPESTFEACFAINYFSTTAKKDFFQTMNLGALVNYIETAGNSLNALAYLQKASVSSGIARKHFNAELVLENEAGVEIKGGMVQGTKFRPAVRVKGFSGVAAPRFNVKLQSKFGESVQSFNLLYSKEEGKHIGTEVVGGSDKIGQFQFNAVVRYPIAGVGSLALDFHESRTVGYKIEVEARATVEATGKDVAEGEDVAPGTEFVFDLSMYDASGNRLSEGDFEVTMSVFDSSSALFDEQKQNIQETGEAPISFSYTLDKKNVPAGKIVFEFEVSSVNVGVHSKSVVKYRVSSALVASQITFEGFSGNNQPTFKVGEKVQVSIVPAAFPDLRSVLPFDHKNLEGKPILRDLYMDVVAAGQVIVSVRGIPKEGTYSFTVPLQSSLDAFGVSSVSFRYVTTDDESIELQSYNSEFSELYEDASQLQFSVPAEFVVEQVEKKFQEDLFYGNNIQLNFKLRDKNSGKLLRSGVRGSNVFLALEHSDDQGNKYISTTKPASQSQDTFEINWSITPNAVKGPATIVLYAHGAGGQKIAISDKQGNPVEYQVNIGGEIEVESNTYASSSSADDRTSFVASFSLSCQGNPLIGARLSADLLNSNGKVVRANVPVSANEEDYQVSVSMQHKVLPEGEYKFSLYRDTDLDRSGEERESLFDITLNHLGSEDQSLPLSPQALIFVFLVAGFGFVVFKRSELTA